MELTELGHLLSVPGLAHAVGRVEGVMADLLAAADATLSEPCLRLLRGRGKRVRPALVIAAAACAPRPPSRGPSSAWPSDPWPSNGEPSDNNVADPPTSDGQRLLDETVLAAAAAVEFLHIGSLVHDDIMDHAEDRRGVATISFKEGPNTALLCGDVLFALSGQAAALAGQTAAIESARTIIALCNGQMREMVDNFNPTRSERSILATIEGKTAALLQFSCRLGGICGGLDGPAIDALGAYGHDFGMSFQLVDDVLDFVSSQAASGKPVLNDLRCGVYTLPVAMALRDDYGGELGAALELANGAGVGVAAHHDARLTDAQVGSAAAILRSGDYFRRVLDLALDYARRAAGHLSVLPHSPTVDGLARLPELYVEEQLRAVADEADLGVPASVSGS